MPPLRQSISDEKTRGPKLMSLLKPIVKSGSASPTNSSTRLAAGHDVASMVQLLTAWITEGDWPCVMKPLPKRDPKEPGPEMNPGTGSSVTSPFTRENVVSETQSNLPD